MTSTDQKCENNDLGEDLHRNFNKLCVQNQLKGRFMQRAIQNRLKLLKIKKQCSKRISNNIIHSILRYIRTTPKRIKEGPEFIDEIRKHLYFLYEYNCSFFKQKKKYPYTRHLATVLEHYVALEYEALYSTRSDNIKYESVVEKRIMCLLQYMCRDPNSEDIRPFEASIRVLRILNRMDEQYKDDDKLIGKIMKKLSKKLGIQNAIDQVKEAQMSVLHVQSNALFKLLMEDNYDSSSYEDDESENVDTPQISKKDKTTEEENNTQSAAIVKVENVKIERPVLTIELNDSDGEDVWMEYLTEETKSNKRDSIMSNRLILKDCMDIKKDLKSVCKNGLSVNSGDSFKTKSTNVNKSYFEYLNSFTRDTVIKSDEENYRCCGLSPCSTKFSVSNDVVVVLDDDEDAEPKNCNWKEERLRPLDNDCFIISSDEEEVEEMGQKKIAQLEKCVEFPTSKLLQSNEFRKDNSADSESQQSSSNQCSNLLHPVSKQVYINQQPRLLEFESEVPQTSEEGEVVKGLITLRNIRELTRQSITLNDSENTEITNVQTLKKDLQQEINEDILLNDCMYEENHYTTDLTEEELLLEEEVELPVTAISCNSNSSQVANDGILQGSQSQECQINSSLNQAEKSKKVEEASIDCFNVDNELLRLQVDYESDEASSKSSNSSNSLKEATESPPERNSLILNEQLNTNLKSLSTIIPDKPVSSVIPEIRNTDNQVKVQIKSALNNVNLSSKDQTNIGGNNTKTCQTKKVRETNSDKEINKRKLEFSTNSLSKKLSPSKTNSEVIKKKSLIWEKIKYAVQNYDCVEPDTINVIEEYSKIDPIYTDCLETMNFHNKINDSFIVHDVVETVITHFDEPNLLMEENSPEIPSPFFEKIEEHFSIDIAGEIEIEHLETHKDESFSLIQNISPMILQYGSIEGESQNEEQVSNLKIEQNFQIQTAKAKEKIEISRNIAVVIEEIIPKDDVQIFEGEIARKCHKLEELHDVVSNAEAFIEQIVPEVSYYEDIEEEAVPEIIYMEPSEVVEETIVDIEETIQNVNENSKLNDILDQDEKIGSLVNVFETNQIVVNNVINEDLHTELIEQNLEETIDDVINKDLRSEEIEQHLEESINKPLQSKNEKFLDQKDASTTEIEITSTEKMKENIPAAFHSCSFEVNQEQHTDFSQEVDIVAKESYTDVTELNELCKEKDIRKLQPDHKIFKEILSEKEVDNGIEKAHTNFNTFPEKLIKRKTVEVDIQQPSTSFELFDELPSGNESIQNSHARTSKEKFSKKKKVIDVQKPSTSSETFKEELAREKEVDVSSLLVLADTAIQREENETKRKNYKVKRTRKLKKNAAKPRRIPFTPRKVHHAENKRITRSKELALTSTPIEFNFISDTSPKNKIYPERIYDEILTTSDDSNEGKLVIDEGLSDAAIEKEEFVEDIVTISIPDDSHCKSETLILLQDVEQLEFCENSDNEDDVPLSLRIVNRKNMKNNSKQLNRKRNKDLVNTTQYPTDHSIKTLLAPVRNKSSNSEKSIIYNTKLDTNIEESRNIVCSIVDDLLNNLQISKKEVTKVVKTKASVKAYQSSIEEIEISNLSKSSRIVGEQLRSKTRYQGLSKICQMDVTKCNLQDESSDSLLKMQLFDNEGEVDKKQERNQKKIISPEKKEKSDDKNTRSNEIFHPQVSKKSSKTEIETPASNTDHSQTEDNVQKNNFEIFKKGKRPRGRPRSKKLSKEISKKTEMKKASTNYPESAPNKSPKTSKSEAENIKQKLTKETTKNKRLCNNFDKTEEKSRKSGTNSSSDSNGESEKQIDAKLKYTKRTNNKKEAVCNLLNEKTFDNTVKKLKRNQISNSCNSNDEFNKQLDAEQKYVKETKDKINEKTCNEEKSRSYEKSNSSDSTEESEEQIDTKPKYRKGRRNKKDASCKNLQNEETSDNSEEKSRNANSNFSDFNDESRKQIDVKQKNTKGRTTNKKDALCNDLQSENIEEKARKNGISISSDSNDDAMKSIYVKQKDSNHQNEKQSRNTDEKTRKIRKRNFSDSNDESAGVKRLNINSQSQLKEQQASKNSFDFFTRSPIALEAGPSRNSRYIPEAHENQNQNLFSDETSSNDEYVQLNSSPRNYFLSERLKVLETLKLSEEAIINKSKDIESEKETKLEKAKDCSKYSKYNHSEIQILFDQMLKKSEVKQMSPKTKTMPSKLALKTMKFLSKFKFSTLRQPPVNDSTTSSPSYQRNEPETHLFEKKFNNTTIITNDSFMNSNFGFTYKEDDKNSTKRNESIIPSTSASRREGETSMNSVFESPDCFLSISGFRREEEIQIDSSSEPTVRNESSECFPTTSEFRREEEIPNNSFPETTEVNELPDCLLSTSNLRLEEETRISTSFELTEANELPDCFSSTSAFQREEEIQIDPLSESTVRNESPECLPTTSAFRREEQTQINLLGVDETSELNERQSPIINVETKEVITKKTDNDGKEMFDKSVLKEQATLNITDTNNKFNGKGRKGKGKRNKSQRVTVDSVPSNSLLRESRDLEDLRGSKVKVASTEESENKAVPSKVLVREYSQEQAQLKANENETGLFKEEAFEQNNVSNTTEVQQIENEDLILIAKTEQIEQGTKEIANEEVERETDPNMSKKILDGIDKEEIIEETKENIPTLKNMEVNEKIEDNQLNFKENESELNKEECYSKSSKIIQEEDVALPLSEINETIDELMNSEDIMEDNGELEENKIFKLESSQIMVEDVSLKLAEANKKLTEESTNLQDVIEERKEQEVNSEPIEIIQNVNSTTANENRLEQLFDSKGALETDKVDSKENEVNSELSIVIPQEDLMEISIKTNEHIVESNDVSFELSVINQENVVPNSIEINEESIGNSIHSQDILDLHESMENEDLEKVVILNSNKTNEKMQELKDSENMLDEEVKLQQIAEYLEESHDNEEEHSESKIVQEDLIKESIKLCEDETVQVDLSESEENEVSSEIMKVVGKSKVSQKLNLESSETVQKDLIIKSNKTDERIEELNDSQDLIHDQFENIEGLSNLVVESTKLDEITEGSEDYHHVIKEEEELKSNELATKVIKEDLNNSHGNYEQNSKEEKNNLMTQKDLILNLSKINESQFEGSKNSQDLIEDNALESKGNEEVASSVYEIIQENLIKINEERTKSEYVVKKHLSETEESNEKREIIIINETKSEEFELDKENTSATSVAQLENEMLIENDGDKERGKKRKILTTQDVKLPNIEFAVEAKEQNIFEQKIMEESEDYVDTNIKNNRETCNEVERKSEKVIETFVAAPTEMYVTQDTNVSEEINCGSTENLKVLCYNTEKEDGSKTPLRKRKMVLDFGSPKRKHKTIDMVISNLKNKDRNLDKSMETEDVGENLLVCEIKERLQSVKSDWETSSSNEIKVVLDSETDETAPAQIKECPVFETSEDVTTLKCFENVDDKMKEQLVSGSCFVEENTEKMFAVETKSIGEIIEVNMEVVSTNAVANDATVELNVTNAVMNVATMEVNAAVDEVTLEVNATNAVVDEPTMEVNVTNADENEATVKVNAAVDEVTLEVNAPSAVEDEVTIEVNTVVSEATMEVNVVIDEATMVANTVVDEETMEVNAVADEATMEVNTVADEATMEVNAAVGEATVEVNAVVDEATVEVNTVVDKETMKVNALIDEVTMDINAVVDEASMEVNATVDETTMELNAAVDEETMEVNAVVDEATMEINVAVNEATMEVNTVVDEATREVNAVVDEGTVEANAVVDEATMEVNAVVDEATIEIDAVNVVLVEAKENTDIKNEIGVETIKNYVVTSAVYVGPVNVSNEGTNLVETSFVEPEENNKDNLELEEQIGTVSEETRENSQSEVVALEVLSNPISGSMETTEEINLDHQMQVAVDGSERDPIFQTKSETNDMFSCVNVSKELPSQILDYHTNEDVGSFSNFEVSSKSESTPKNNETLVSDHFNMPSTSAFNFVSPTSLEIISSDEPIDFMQTSMGVEKKSNEGDTEKNKKLTYLRIGSETTDHNYYSPGGPLLGGKYDNDLNKSNSSSLGNLKENELTNTERDMDNSPVDSEAMFSVPEQFDISILDDNVVEISDGLDDDSVDVHNNYELSETVGQLNFPLITESLESTTTRDMNALLIDKNCIDSMQFLQDFLKHEANEVVDQSNDVDTPRHFQNSIRQLGAALTSIPWWALKSLANWGFDDMAVTDPDEAGDKRPRSKSESKSNLASPVNMMNDGFIIGPGTGPHKSSTAVWNDTPSKSDIMKRPNYDARVNAARRYRPNRFTPPKKLNKKKLRKSKEVDTKMAISVYNRSKSAKPDITKLKNELASKLEMNTTLVQRRNERTPVSAPKKRPPETKTFEAPPSEKPSPLSLTSNMSSTSVSSAKDEVSVDVLVPEEVVTEEVIEIVSKDKKIQDKSEIEKMSKPIEKEIPPESKHEEVYENKFDIIKRRQRPVTTNYAMERLLQNEDKNKRMKAEKSKPKEQSPKLPENENKKTKRRSPNEDSLQRLPPSKNSISSSLPSTSNCSASKNNKRKFNFSDSDSDNEEDKLPKVKLESADVLFEKLVNADNSNRLKHKVNDNKQQEDCKKPKFKTDDLKHKTHGNCKPKIENDHKSRDEYRDTDRKRKELDRNDKVIIFKKRRESLQNIRTPSPAYSNGSSSVSQTDKYNRHKRRKDMPYSDRGHYHYSQADDKHVRRQPTFNGTRSNDYSYRNTDQRYTSKSLDYSSRYHDDSRLQRRSSVGSQLKQDWYSKTRPLSNTRLVNPRMNPNKSTDNSWWDKMTGLLPTQDVYFPSPETSLDNK